ERDLDLPIELLRSFRDHHVVIRPDDAVDASMRADIAEPLIFVAWLRESVRGIYADDPGPAFGSFFHPQAKAIIRLLKGDATSRDWCDDGRTPERESCSDVLASALRRALEDLEKIFGTDRAKWRR